MGRRALGRRPASAGFGYPATFDGPAPAAGCALTLHQALADLDVAIRTGVHTGEIELWGDDIGGITVGTVASAVRV